MSPLAKRRYAPRTTGRAQIGHIGLAVVLSGAGTVASGCGSLAGRRSAAPDPVLTYPTRAAGRRAAFRRFFRASASLRLRFTEGFS